MPQKISSTRKLLLACSAAALAYTLIRKDVPDVLKNAATALSLRGDKSLPRGLRNNNPGNLRKGVAWAGRDGDDGAFDIFKSMDAGIRAAHQNLMTAITKHKCTTVRKLITRWAPPSENDTEAYIAFVCKTAPISANEVINVTDADTISRILYAVFQHENGPAVAKKYISFQSVLDTARKFQA
jgi:hypothetical protein